jgi:hypothetical protein
MKMFLVKPSAMPCHALNPEHHPNVFGLVASSESQRDTSLPVLGLDLLSVEIMHGDVPADSWLIADSWHEPATLDKT